MDPRQFYEEVKKMRQLQKTYFRTRRQGDLEASKAQEKIIDKEIARVELVLAEKEEAKQPKLF